MMELEEEQHQKSAEYFEDIREQFKIAQLSIQADIEKWYYRLADNNGISYAAAKKLLKKRELEEFKWTLEQYIQKGRENAVSEEWMKELENASARYHINYLEALKLQVQQHAEILYAEYESRTAEFLGKVFKEQFYRTAYEIAKGTGVGTNLAVIDTRRIDAVLKRPWAQDGRVFSDRIWQNKERLVRELHTELVQNIIRGESPRKAIDNLAKKMNVSRTQAGTLIMTEESAIASEASRKCFEELDVEKYKVIATLDGKTCDICGSMDGKVFRMAEYEAGITANPFHPNCRCCTAPYFDNWYGLDRKRTALDPVTGKEYKVPADMTYQEWMDKYVKNDILNSANTKEVIQVHSIGKLDRDIYKCITDDIVTDEVIITDERIDHIIQRRGKDFYDKYDKYFADIIENPDYIFKDRKNTALVCKEFIEDNKYVNIALRIAVSEDNPNYKNSIITAVGESEKRFRQRLRNNEPLYKKE